MNRLQFAVLSSVLILMLVACGGNDDGGAQTTDEDTDNQSNSGAVNVVWEITGSNDDFADDINIRLGQLGYMDDTLMVDSVKMGDLAGYFLRYDPATGEALEPLDLAVAYDGFDDGLLFDDVVMDSDGSYWGLVPSRSVSPIVHFDADGNVLAEFGEHAPLGSDGEAGQIRGARDIFIGADDNLYVHESQLVDSPHISVWSREGDFIREFSTNLDDGLQGWLRVSGGGDIVITSANRAITDTGFDVLDLEGNVTRENVGIDLPIQSTRTTSPNPILGINVDADGNAVFVTRLQLYRLNSDGEITHVYEAPLTRNDADDLSSASEIFRWQDVVVLPGGDAVALYSNTESWVLVRVSFD